MTSKRTENNSCEIGGDDDHDDQAVSGPSLIQTNQTDPFMLLKEVVEMSKYMNAAAAGSTQSDANSTTRTSDFQLKCEMNMSNYRAMV